MYGTFFDLLKVFLYDISAYHERFILLDEAIDRHIGHQIAKQGQLSFIFIGPFLVDGLLGDWLAEMFVLSSKYKWEVKRHPGVQNLELNNE